MKKLTLCLFIICFFYSCSSNQKKAEKSVSEFIVKFSTYPNSYEAIDFSDLESVINKYGIKEFRIKHAYRIKDKSGKLKVTAHEFKLSESMNVYIDFMEEFE